MRFRLGAPEARLAVAGKAQDKDGKARRGTEITFLPSTKFFAPEAFDVGTLEEGLRGLVLANAGVNLVLRDRRGADERAVLLTSGSRPSEESRGGGRAAAPLANAFHDRVSVL